MVVTSELKNKIDQLWDAFWSGGISNPLEILEQVTCLMFIRRLDNLPANPDSNDGTDGTPVYTDDTMNLRWSRFTQEAPQNMLITVRDQVFPWLRTFGGDGSTYSNHVKNAHFSIPTPGLLVRAVETVDEIASAETSTQGDLYEYMLRRIATGPLNGQLLTPRHIIQLMVEMVAPTPNDEICDPACGTAGFLVESAEYVQRAHREMSLEPTQRQHFNHSMFHGFDFDSTALRLGSMNMLLHSVEDPDIRYRDSLVESTAGEADRYSLILSDPPFAGGLDSGATNADLQQVVKTKKTELLFLALFLRLLKPGGRAAVIVPEGVLFGSSKAHQELRKLLVENHNLDAVVKLPSGVFKPYAGVSRSIIFFTKTNCGGTDNVWFYDITADGWSLDHKRAPLLAEDRLGPVPRSGPLYGADHRKNNLPDVLARWNRRHGGEQQRARTEQSFFVPREEIVKNGYDLSLACYRRNDELKKDSHDVAWRLGDIAEVLPGWVDIKEIEEAPDNEHVPSGLRVLHPTLLTSTLPELEDLPIVRNAREPRNRLRPGDIVGRDLASARHWTVLPKSYDGVQAGRGLLIIRTTGDAVPREYLAAYLSSPQAEARFPRYDVIPRIRRQDLTEILVPACDGTLGEVGAAALRLEEGIKEASRFQTTLYQSKISIFENCSPAERKIRLEQAGDLSWLVAQSLRKHSEPYQLFQEAYPYSTARAVRRFKHSLTLTDKHEAALQCVESLVLSLGIVSLALAAHNRWNKIPEVASWAEGMERGGVSLGHWVAVVRAVGSYARETGDAALGLAEATTSRRRKGLLVELAELVNVRNKISHGAGPRTRAEVERSLANLEDLMMRSLASSAFLAKIQWIYTERLQWVPDIGKYQVSGLTLTGDHPDFAPVRFDTTLPLADSSLYLRTQQGETIPLSPFVVLNDCPDCLTPELYYPDRLTDTTARLKSLDRGHELDSAAVSNALRRWIKTW